MLIEIVTHCWRYSRVLTWQLSSLFLHPPEKCLAIAAVYYDPADETTQARLNWFYTLWKGPMRSGLSNLLLHPRPLERPYLLNRAIGRNRAAKVSQADAVWFADADYCFGPGCLDALAAAAAEQRLRPDAIHFPREYQMQIDKHRGDRCALAAEHAGLLDVDPADFRPVPCRKAIGGMQIVAGETARAKGYCPGSRDQQPAAADAETFNFRSDVRYRRQFAAARPLELPNLYRIRQSTSGMVDTLGTRSQESGVRRKNHGSEGAKLSPDRKDTSRRAAESELRVQPREAAAQSATASEETRLLTPDS